MIEKKTTIKLKPLAGRDFKPLNEYATYMTPSQLADALESGNYNIALFMLGDSVSNCCLGVYAREIGVDVGLLEGCSQLCNISIDFTGNGIHYDMITPPWMTDIIVQILVRFNDAGCFVSNSSLGFNTYDNKILPESRRWEKLTIPFLRMLKINKDGYLSARQLKAVDLLVKDHTHYSKNMTPEEFEFIKKALEKYEGLCDV